VLRFSPAQMILTYIQMIFNEKKNGLKICKILKGKKINNPNSPDDVDDKFQ
jgi:hypothetical protein